MITKSETRLRVCERYAMHVGFAGEGKGGDSSWAGSGK